MHPFITLPPIISTRSYSDSPAVGDCRKRSITKNLDINNQICSIVPTNIKMAEFKRSVKKYNKNKIICLVNQGIDINQYCSNKTHKDICPVELAILNDDIKLLKFLLESGANPNIQHESTTALDLLVIQGIFNENYEEMIKLLVKYGADINHIDSDGCSILDTTIILCKHKIARWLLGHGAKNNLKNQFILKFIKKEL